MNGCGSTARKVTIVLWAALALAATGGGAAFAAPSHAHRSPPTVTVGGNPIGVAVDNATHTVYVANNTDNTVSVLNAATCNAKHTAGCSQHPPTVRSGRAHRRRSRPEDQHRLRRQYGGRHRVGDRRQDVQREGHLGLQQGANHPRWERPERGRGQ